MQEILVTGGLGYIGSHTISELVKAGYACVIVDNLSNGFKESISSLENKNITFYQLDVRDKKSLYTVFAKHNFSAVIHLAGLAIVEESFSREKEYMDNNVNGTMVVLDLCKEFNVKNLIFSSSSTIYGNANKSEKLIETDYIKPISPYGISKLLCEEEITHSALNYIILRYFNVSGASSDLSNGQRGAGSQRVFFNMTNAAINKTDFFINGSHYPTQDGTCVRDYIHVEDIADIHLKAINYLLQKQNNQTENIKQKILNCGYGKGFSIKEIVEVFKKVNEIDFNVKIKAERQGDPAFLVGDSRELIKLFSWSSRFKNPLEVICKTMYGWQKRQKSE